MLFYTKAAGFQTWEQELNSAQFKTSISKYFILPIWATQLLFQTILPWLAHDLDIQYRVGLERRYKRMGSGRTSSGRTDR